MSVVMGDFRPSLAELRADTLDGHSVAIEREILADLDTPVSAYLKLRGAGPSFLLESAEGGERIGRYSFIGTRPRHVLRMKDGACSVDGAEPVPCADPLAAVRSLVEAYGAPVSP